MSVIAMSGAYGSQDRKTSLSYSQTSVASNGTVTESGGGSTHIVDYHIRSGKTSNPLIVKNGVGPFREASSYHRAIVNCKGIYPANYVRKVSTSTVSSRGYPASSVTEYPFLWSHPVNRFGTFQPDDDRDRCTTECLAKLNEDKLDLGTFLAESVKSANQIADLASTLYRDLLDYSRRIRSYKRNPWQISREVANGYLGFKYGISPLTRDLYKQAQIWNNGGLDKPLVVSASHNIVSRHRNTSDRTGWVNRTQNVTNLTQVKLFATISSDFKRTANQIGLANPLGVAWELVPYSFVVDWGLPIGTFLEALNANVGLNFLDGYRLTRTSTKIRADRAMPSGARGTPMHFRYEALSMTRAGFDSFPKPVIYAKNPFSTGNVLSALALFRQLLRDR